MTRFILILMFCFTVIPCYANSHYSYIEGFSAKTNQQLKNFLKETETYSGRKVAVFDLDGTVMGQAPYYLADESLYAYALAHPNRKPNLIKKMSSQSNVSIPYVANRVHYFAGLTPSELEKIGNKTFKECYSDKFFPEIKALINNLKQNGFEIWVVSASPEFVYQGFVSRTLDIPSTHVVGIKSVVKNGKTTDQIIPPIAQDEGKADAIQTIIKTRPLFAAGNSIGDIFMLKYSKNIRIILNPDNKIPIPTLNGLTLKQYAKQQHWLIAYTNDIPEKHYDWASQKFHIRINQSNIKEAHDSPVIN